jgi:hypothetical protein
MSRILVVIFAFYAAAGFAVESPERAAQTAAESWLALVDSGKAYESWQALAEPARQAIGEWRWKLGFSMSQHKFGTFSGRTLRSARFSTKSPSGRTGEYVFIEFQITSSKRGAVIEKLATMHEADGWHVVTYTVE